MKFFTPAEHFTHTGSFYGVPIYCDFTNEIPTIAGRNIVFDDLFMVMILFHNYVIELLAQIFVAIGDQPYEPGFPVWIDGEIDN